MLRRFLRILLFPVRFIHKRCQVWWVRSMIPERDGDPIAVNVAKSDLGWWATLNPDCGFLPTTVFAETPKELLHEVFLLARDERYRLSDDGLRN